MNRRLLSYYDLYLFYKHFAERQVSTMKVKKMMATIIAGLCVIGSINFTTKYSDYKISVVNAEENIKEDEEIHIWDGTSDISWYDEDDTEFHINTPEEFAGIATLSSKGNTFKDKTIYLEKDLYFNLFNKLTKELPAIKSFDGVFDGNNHYLFNVKSTTIFESSSDTIQNLNVVNSSAKYAGICQKSTGSIINCYYNGTSNNNGICSTGKIIKDCVFDGTITINKSEFEFKKRGGNYYYYKERPVNACGGICGRAMEISRCFTYGKAIATSSSISENRESLNPFGGIEGECQTSFVNTYGGKIENSANHMDININNHPSKWVGGILGYTGIRQYRDDMSLYYTECTIEVNNCYNSGDIIGGAGIIGSYLGGSFNNVYASSAPYDHAIGSESYSHPYNDEDSDEKYNNRNIGIIYFPSSAGAACNSGSFPKSFNIKAKTEKNMKSENFAEELGDEFLYVSDSYPILKCELDNPHLRFNAPSITIKNDETSKLELRDNNNKEITWMSSNPNIVSVDNNGVVKAEGSGIALIYALYGDSYAVCVVNSYMYYLKPDKLTLKVKESQSINAYINEEKMKIDNYSSDSNIVTVSNDGLITGISAGSCNVIVTVDGVDLSCEVTVFDDTNTTTAPPSPTIDKPTVSIKSGEKSEIKIMNYSGDITWVSSDTRIATVTKGKNNTATIEGIAAGSAKIYAMISGGKNLTCEVEVSEDGEANIKYGDANCDGTVDLSDAVIIMQSISNPSKFGEKGTAKTHITTQGQINGDVSGNKDGLTNKDALAIQKYMLQLITTLPE